MTIEELDDPTAVCDVLSAAHEAGHAVIHELLGVPYDLVTLQDKLGPARIEYLRAAHLQHDAVEREVICALAGILAETLIFRLREVVEPVIGGISDCGNVRELLGARAADKKYVQGLLEKTLALVEVNLRQIKRVAKALLSQRRLLPQDVRGTGTYR